MSLVHRAGIVRHRRQPAVFIIPYFSAAYSPFSAIEIKARPLLYTIRREMGSRRWTVLTLAWQLAVAYLASFVAYHLALLML